MSGASDRVVAASGRRAGVPVFEVAVVGSGFAGSILARALAHQGLSVALLERARHPRFALGESSTPLAALCLERLARRYGLADLHQLAAYGRWLATYPELRRGLKRGFTFLFHRPGEVFAAGADNSRRLLVAASPEDALADAHWLRADVDAFLARQAVVEGVVLREGFAVAEVVRRDRGFELATAAGDRVAARFVVDASGPGGAVGDALGAGRRRPAARFRSRLVGGHFEGVGPLPVTGPLEPGPYPDDRAAVHHLLAEGWMYVLPFDHDCVSAGLVLAAGDEAGSGEEAAEEAWRRVLARYPSLERQFADARPLRPLSAIEPLQRRRRRAAAVEAEEGRGWALLPHAFAFFDPMFSTGIAWSLLGVERLAAVLGAAGPELARDGLAEGLERYDRLVRREAEQIERLLHGAHLARCDPALLAAQSFLYFASVSFEELRQRLLEIDPIASWTAGGDREHVATGVDGGFLGAGEPGWESLFEEAAARLAATQRCDGAARRALVGGFERWVQSSIAPWNLIGLADPARRNLYPIDLDLLRERAGLLGLSPSEMEARLPLLRGAS